MCGSRAISIYFLMNLLDPLRLSRTVAAATRTQPTPRRVRVACTICYTVH